MGDEIVFNIVDEIGVLRVNRPAARNALNAAARKRFLEVVTAVSTNPTIRVLIITGTGDKSFISGGDLKELRQTVHNPLNLELYDTMNKALQQLQALPIPVVAAVNGDAFGGGCEVLTACDLRIASETARFSLAQMRNAVTTGWGGAGRLVQLLGQSRAMELLLTARVFSAAEAQQIGFVHRLVPSSAAVLPAAMGWARELVTSPQGALAAMKQLVQVGGKRPLTDTYALEKELFASLWGQPDHLEALQAFVEKREPKFNR